MDSKVEQLLLLLQHFFTAPHLPHPDDTSGRSLHHRPSSPLAKGALEARRVVLHHVVPYERLREWVGFSYVATRALKKVKKVNNKKARGS